MKVRITESLALPLRRKEGEVVDLEEVLNLLGEMSIPHRVAEEGVYAPTSYNPDTDTVRLGGNPREQWTLVAPRHWEGRPVRVVIPVVGNSTTSGPSPAGRRRPGGMGSTHCSWRKGGATNAPSPFGKSRRPNG